MASKLTVALTSGERLTASLLLPASPSASRVTDGTSNTIMFSEAFPSADRLKAGFGLLLPAVAKGKFQAGLPAGQVLLLPYTEGTGARPGTQAQGLKMQNPKVTQVTVLGDGSVRVWMEPQSIIAILIGL